MIADIDYFHSLQRYRIRAYRKQLDDKGHPIIGSGFFLNRPDAQAAIERLGLTYEAVQAGLQTLTDAQIDALFEADLHLALEHANQHVKEFSTMHPARQRVVIDMLLDMGPDIFNAFMQYIGSK